MAEISRTEITTMSIPLGRRDIVDLVAAVTGGVLAAIAWALGGLSTLATVLILGVAAVESLLAVSDWRLRRRIDPGMLDAIEDFLALHATDPAAALRGFQQYALYAAQRDRREFYDIKRRAVSDPWAARELVRLLKLQVEVMTQRRRDAAKQVRRHPSGVEDLRWREYLEGLARRQLAEAQARVDRAPMLPT